MLAGVRTVFSELRYATFAVIVAWFVFSLVVWWPNMSLLLQVATNASSFETVQFAFGLYGSIGTNFSVVSAVAVSLLSLLFGLNVALTTYLVRHKMPLFGGAATSTAGMVLAVFGVGCSACGSILLTGLLSSLGGAWLLAWLPYGGEEFLFLGVALLLYATLTLARQVSRPTTCAA